MSSLTELKKLSSQIRRDIVRMVHRAQSGHPGGSLGCTDYFAAMYFDILKHNPKHFDMDGKKEDLFFLSNGHISPVWYSTLARAEYFPLKDLHTFRFINSHLQGHPATKEHTPGVRVASGSLGQGLSVAIGAAITKKLNNDNRFVYSLHGDGEMQEGQIWEAAMFAAHHKIDNLIATIDLNGQQIDGSTKDVINLGNLQDKWKSFGWKTLQMNGNNINEVLSTIKKAKSYTGKQQPVVIIMETTMGYGVDFMMGTHEWHGIAPSDEQLELALKQLPETLGDF